MDRSRTTWRKSSHSGMNGCVEVAFIDGGRVAIRDSKNEQGPVLEFGSLEWDAFVQGVHDGQFNRRLR